MRHTSLNIKREETFPPFSLEHGESRHVKTWLGARSKQEFDFSGSG